MNSIRRAKLPESAPCSSAAAWANSRAKRYGSAAVGHALGPGPGEPARPGVSRLRPAEEARLADPASPTTQDRAPRPVERHRSRAARMPGCSPRGHERARLAGRGTAHVYETGFALQPVQRDRTRLAAQHDRAPVGDREPVARGRDGRVIERGSRRVGRGSGCRAAVVIAAPVSARSSLVGSRAGRATTSPVAIPMRTSSGSAPSARSAQRRPDGEGRKGGPDRVVVVGPRPAEHREDGVADELLARPVEPLDGLGHRRERGAGRGRGRPRGRARRPSGRSRRGPRTGR